MMTQKPGVLMGAFVGGLLMIPVTAVSFLGQQLAGFPFIPSILFGFGRDYAPGELVPRIIGVMSNTIINLNLGRVDVVAKQVEYGLELTTLIVLGIIAGAIFFFLRRRADADPSDSMPGAILGIVVAALVIVMMLALPEPGGVGGLAASLWIVVLFVLWGLAVNWVYNTLVSRAAEAQTAGANAQALNRRQFLVQVGAATATVTVIGAGLGALLNRGDTVTTEPLSDGQPEMTPSAEMASLPNADDPVEPAPGTRPEVTALEDHYRIDIATRPPEIAAEGYTLPFMTALTEDGSMRAVAEMTLDHIRSSYEPVQDYITMSCISNTVAGDLISTIKWTGARMQQILADVEIPANATHLKITAADGFDETVALDLINADERIMLAYEWEDQPLTVEHGFPLRIHIPDLYGMKQPKWITGMEFIQGDQDGYWVRRGWDKEARARATSVIDTVATSAMTTNEDGQPVIPVGGIAWAGARGISKVEVRVDEGEWVEAGLRAPISDRTWYLWRFDWQFTEGAHTLEVRCYDGDETMQIEQPAGTYPSGATGVHSVRVNA